MGGSQKGESEPLETLMSIEGPRIRIWGGYRSKRNIGRFSVSGNEKKLGGVDNFEGEPAVISL